MAGPSILTKLWWSAYLLTHIAGQARYPFKPKKTILRDQHRNIQRMIFHAYRRVPYYRETLDRLGLRPSDFRSAEDLARLPILERHEIQKDPERFMAIGSRLEKCLCLPSSGSSGAPIKVYHDRRAALLTVAHNERYRAVIVGLAGKRRNYRETLIMVPDASSAEHRRFWLGSTLGIKKIIPRKQLLSVFDPPEKNIPLFSAFKPDIIFSFGSYFDVLFARLATRSEPCALPKVAAYGADGLSDQTRRLIQDHLGIEVASSYTSVEAQRLGFECERHSGIHLNEDIYPLRMVDAEGRTLPSGECGEVVVSNLVNRTTVILNYRLGDIAALLPEACPCGRSLPLISFPAGRKDDWVRLRDGRSVHGHILNSLMRGEVSIFQYQIVQLVPAHFRVSLIVKDDADRAELETRIVSKFKKALGEPLQVDFSFVSSIPRTAAGKVKPIISSVRQEPTDGPRSCRDLGLEQKRKERRG